MSFIRIEGLSQECQRIWTAALTQSHAGLASRKDDFFHATFEVERRNQKSYRRVDYERAACAAPRNLTDARLHIAVAMLNAGVVKNSIDTAE
jgi:hypothetical protein